MGWTRYLKLHYLPGLTSAWFIGTFLISYCVAVLDGNVVPFFPFISDSGAKPPESCIFGLLLHLGIIIISACGYVRYRQVGMAIERNYVKIAQKWNDITLVAGGLSCFGVMIVANFQETNVLLVHLAGAGLLFGGAFPYFIIQTWFSYQYTLMDEKFRRYAISKTMFYFRLFLVCSLVPILIVEMIFFTKALLSVKEHVSFANIHHITEEDGDFQSRLIAAFTEWILAIIILAYMNTFTSEFKAVKFKSIEMELNGDHELNIEL